MPAFPDLSLLFPTELPDSLPATGLALLDQEAVLAVQGTDATRFLQGQLTCDVAALQPGEHTLGARCNPQGRMQSSFRLLKLSEQSYLLAMAADLLEPQQQDLSRYAVFFKVQLTDASQQWVRLGLWGEAAATAIAGADLAQASDDEETGRALAIAEQTWEVWLPTAQAADKVRSLSTQAQPLPVEAWELQQIRLGLGQVRGGTRESFIPQMLNLQQLGGVSFRKGCYTGQEIVARMQYLGKLKRRMYRLLWDGEQVPAPGTAVHRAGQSQSVGEVVMAARAGGQVELLAVLQKDAAELPDLTLADSTQPLRVSTLPYEQQMAADEAAH